MSLTSICSGSPTLFIVALFPRDAHFLSALETLVFANVNLGDLETREFTWIPSFLTQVRALSIRKVEFRFVLSKTSQLDIIPLTIIDEVLTSSMFPGLETVSVVLWSGLEESRAEVCHDLQTRLPQINTRGLLAVEFIGVLWGLSSM